MSLHDDNAIVFHDVCKIYRLYKSHWQMVLDVLGVKQENTTSFFALDQINLTIKKGARVGIVGRNGAGKSTLLKLITGNFAATSGTVHVDGQVQALMNTGLGFHPEFTGMENIKASLLYNGLSLEMQQQAIDDIVDFVELGEFLDQPLKTYSLGMQTRLFFAVATAIQPEILIVDEVLGAGDSYFSAKSAERMKKLTHSGCTLLLVSHSTQQILQFCDQAIWLECGKVAMQGRAIDVVKAYEAYSKALEFKSKAATEGQPVEKRDSVIHSRWLREKLLNDVLLGHAAETCHAKNGMKGVSRWVAHENGLKISAINLTDGHHALTNMISSGQKLSIEITLTAEVTQCFDVYFMVLLFTEDGRWLSRHCSAKHVLNLGLHEHYTAKLTFEKVLLGTGKYMFSAGIYNVLDLHDLSTARYYDLLSRSFEFEVKGYYPQDDTIFYHPATWHTQLPDLHPNLCAEDALEQQE